MPKSALWSAIALVRTLTETSIAEFQHPDNADDVRDEDTLAAELGVDWIVEPAFYIPC